MQTSERPQHRTNFAQNKVFIDANLSARFQFFDPDDPARYQLYGKLGISMPLPYDWALRGTYAVDIDNTFNEISRASDSVLPHVRSDVARYLSEGETGMDSLFLEKRGSFSPELHYRFYAGVLEEMYSGAGGELLYQPYRSRLAFGLSSNRVQQRAYDKSFDLLITRQIRLLPVLIGHLRSTILTLPCMRVVIWPEIMVPPWRFGEHLPMAG